MIYPAEGVREAEVGTGYAFFLLLRVGLFSGVFELAGSVSSGAGGGVVSIVQPIQADITRTSRTKSRTGIPIAQSCQYAGSPTYGAKNNARYTIATMSEIMKMVKP